MYRLFYLIEYAGVDPANGLFYKNTTNTDGTVDRTTTNDYSMAKRVIAGNPFPTLMTGMTNTLNYKGIDLLFRENGALAYTIQQESTNCAADYFDNQTVDQLNRWQNPGDITNAASTVVWR
jgi:hypothetical protein